MPTDREQVTFPDNRSAIANVYPLCSVYAANASKVTQPRRCRTMSMLGSNGSVASMVV